MRKTATSFDHRVRAGELRGRNINAESFCGLEIDDSPEFRGLLDRNVARLGAFEDPVDEISCASKEIGEVSAVAGEPAVFRQWQRTDRQQAAFGGKLGNGADVVGQHRVLVHDEAADLRVRPGREYAIEF